MVRKLSGGIVQTIASDPSVKDFVEKFQPYAIELGAFVYGWNQLHDDLATIFWAVVGTPNGRIPLAVWHSTNSDRAQREMLRAAAKGRFPTAREQDAQPLQRIEWLITQTDKLANFRNDVIHAPYLFVTDPPPAKLVANTIQGNPRAKGLKDRDLLHEFQRARETAMVLSGFARRLNVSLHNLGAANAPLPKTPALPNRGHKTSSRPN